MSRVLHRRYGHASADPEIVARGKTFDGYDVNMHADGALSTRSHFIGRSKLPRAAMWPTWKWIETYTLDELSGLIKAVRAGKNPGAPSRRTLTEAEHEKILAGQVRRHMFVDHDGVIKPVNLGGRR